MEKDGRQKGEVGVVSYFLFSVSDYDTKVKNVSREKKKAPHYDLSAYRSVSDPEDPHQGFLNWTSV